MSTHDAADLSDRLRLLVWDLGRRLRLESGSQSDELTWSQQAVLRRLYETPRMTSAELARADLVRPQSMSVTVAGLRERGLVQAQRGAGDARRHELFLTERGREAVAAVFSRRDAWLRDLIETELSPREREELNAGLGLLRRLLEAAPGR